MKWGLIPFWAKDPKIGSRMINARAETVAEKPAFRNALKKRRCLVLADGYYEWQKTPVGKRPFRIVMRSGESFAFAGIWETWKDIQGNVVPSCTIITTAANDFLSPDPRQDASHPASGDGGAVAGPGCSTIRQPSQVHLIHPTPDE